MDRAMITTHLPSHRHTRARQPHPVAATALVTLHAMTPDQVSFVARVLQDHGMADVKQVSFLLSRRDAQRVESGSFDPIEATLVPAPRDHVSLPGQNATELEQALSAARARGATFKQELLADPGMLSTADMAERLGMSQEGVRLKRKRHEILGLECARRGIRYPAWQLLPDARLLPGLPKLFQILGPDPWRVYRFLLQHHQEAGGACALDALKRGDLTAVLTAAQNAAAGAFA